MTGRRRTLLSALSSALLIFCTAFSTPAMVVHGLHPAAPDHHGDHHSSGPSHHHSADDCCDLCWISCSAPVGPPQSVVLPSSTIRTVVVSVSRTAGLPGAGVFSHRLPFSIGPPALQA